MVYGLLAITLLVALISLISIWAGSGKDIRHNWHQILAALSVAVFIYLYGTWVYLTIQAKYVFGALFLLCFISGFFRKKKVYKGGIGRMISNLIIALTFGTMSILYFTGTTGKPKKAALTFPLKTGKYFILQGGKGLPTNFFHMSYRGAAYAIDIVKLNEFGNRANSVFSDKLEDYLIYNDTIFSPCDGRIVRTRDENPDNTPPIRDRGPSNTNQVVIESANFTVFLAHLKQFGVFVKEGDLVKTGQPLGLVGNSGFSLEPHLHIQVHENSRNGGSWWDEPQLYPEFDGRTYLLFEVIRPKRVRMVDEH
jgi:hypothetical protein